MLKVSSRVHYGLRAMTELAKVYGAGPLALSEIARTENLPLAYLEQLVADLRRECLVEGTRGVKGGYRLTRPPSEIAVADVVQALEGPLVLVECLAEDYQTGSCEREVACLSRSVWHRVQHSIEQVLRSTTLKDLCAGQPAGQTLIPLVTSDAREARVG